MELNILLEGERAAVTATSIAHNLSALIHGVRHVRTGADDLTPAGLSSHLKRSTWPFDVVVFDDIETPAQLFVCVEGIKQFRADRPTKYTAIFVCGAGVICLSNAVPLIVNGEVSPEQEAALREAFEASGDKPRGLLTVVSDEVKIEYLGPGVSVAVDQKIREEEQYDRLKATVTRWTKNGFTAIIRKELEKYIPSTTRPALCNLAPQHFDKFETFLAGLDNGAPTEKSYRQAYSDLRITWDEGTESYTAAALWIGKQILCTANRVAVYNNLKTRILFEEGPARYKGNLDGSVSGVKGLDTHFFSTGEDLTFKLNWSYVRPANDDEVSEYLKAKYDYEKIQTYKG